MSDRFTLTGTAILAAAGSAISINFCPPTAAEKWKIISLAYVPKITSATNGTNYCAVRPYTTAGTSVPVAASRNTAATSFTINVAEPITLTGVGVELEVSQAAPLHFDITQAASGVLVEISVMATFEAVRV